MTMGTRLVGAVLALGVLFPPATPAAVRVERVGRGTSESVPTIVLEGRPYIGANALARLVNGTKYWRPDLKKLEIRSVRHSLRLTVDTPYAVVDEVAIRLGSPVRMVAGEVHAPLDVFPLALSGRFLARAAWDPRTNRIVIFAQDPNLGPPRMTVSGPRTRLVLPITERLEPQILSARRSRFLIEVPQGVLTAVPGDSLTGHGLLSAVKFRREPGALLVDLGVRQEARGYRVQVRDSLRLLEIELLDSVPAGFVAFAPEYGAPPNRPLRVLILDPGHGGLDSGYVAPGGLKEKDLSLALARQLRDRLRERLPAVDVRLTRESDVNPTPTARVEAANRLHGDLYLSLHFDAVPGTAARGVSATVAPPLGFDVESQFAGADGSGRQAGSRPLGLVSWRNAAGRYASDSRGVAELLLAAMMADGRSPARLRQARVLPIEGANMPAVMLECGVLTDAGDQKRLADAKGVSSLADVLSRALERYAGGGFWP